MYGPRQEICSVLVVFLQFQIRIQQALQNFVAIRAQRLHIQRLVHRMPRRRVLRKSAECCLVQRLQQYRYRSQRKTIPQRS